MSGNNERIVNDGLARLREDVEIVIDVLRRADMSLQKQYSIAFLATMAIIGGVRGTTAWIRTVARLVRDTIEEMNNDIILERG